MPKKRNQQFKAVVTKPSRSTHSKDPSSGSTRTVNERLAQLRAEQAPRPTIEQRNDIATLATLPTLPPHLRRILDVPESAPPLPKRGTRRIMRINGRRAPPGPAAPQSWLAASMHAPAHVKARLKQAGRGSAAMRPRPDTFSKLALLDGSQALPEAGSLLDYSLKSMAVDWEFIAEYEQFNLATLPIRWKVALLSYLSIYGPDEGITIASLKTLFLTEDELPGATGSEDLVRLDLSGLLTGTLTIADLQKFLYKTSGSANELSSEVETLSIKASKAPLPVEDTIADSWEDVAATTEPPPTPGLKMKLFPNLARLSLANPGKFASWSGLLSLTSHLPTLTHLSLANWPLPTTTPNSKAAFITYNHASIPVSGTHFYNRLDDDWAEASSLLRRLSKNTYRLQWLDLEGCGDWLPALTWFNANERLLDRWVDRTFRGSNNSSGFDDQVAAESKYCPGPDWNGSWASVKYVNISQGTIPRDVAAVRSIPAGVVAAELLLWLRDDENTKEEDVERSRGMDVHQWLQREKEARAVERTVRALRSSAGGVFCEFDHGWTRPMGAAAAVFKGKKNAV